MVAGRPGCDLALVTGTPLECRRGFQNILSESHFKETKISLESKKKKYSDSCMEAPPSMPAAGVHLSEYFDDLMFLGDFFQTNKAKGINILTQLGLRPAASTVGGVSRSEYLDNSPSLEKSVRISKRILIPGEIGQNIQANPLLWRNMPPSIHPQTLSVQRLL